MANVVYSPYMTLPVPVTGVDPGPDYANNVNASLNIIDQHNHTPGSGQLITPAAMNINANLPFNDNSLTGAMTVRFQPQLSTIPATGLNLGCIYEAGVDLYYNDGSGNIIRLTQSGAIAGPPGSISNLAPPASASYNSVSGTFVFQSAATTSANLDGASITLRDFTPSSPGLTLSPPAGLGADYTITLPTLPPQQSFVTLDQFGNMAAPWTVDNSSIIISSNQLTVNSAGIPAIAHNYITHQWQLNGPYQAMVPSFPLLEIDGYCFFNYNATIIAIWIYNAVAGGSGTTEFDIKIGTSGSSFSSILSTTGQITSSAASGVWTDSNSVVGAQTGVVKPIVMSANVNAGQALRLDILQAMVGASDCGVIVQFVPR